MPSPELNRTIIAVLNRYPLIRLAILFGSVAAGTARTDSDLDLAVDAGQPLTASDKMSLISELAESTGRPVDLVDIQTAGEPLTGQILKYGIRLMGSDAQYASLIRRHLFDQADFIPYRERILRERRRAWIGK